MYGSFKILFFLNMSVVVCIGKLGLISFQESQVYLFSGVFL